MSSIFEDVVCLAEKGQGLSPEAIKRIHAEEDPINKRNIEREEREKQAYASGNSRLVKKYTDRNKTKKGVVRTVEDSDGHGAEADLYKRKAYKNDRFADKKDEDLRKKVQKESAILDIDFK